MRKSNIKIEPATMAYAREFYGDQYTKSFKGYAALLNDKVVGIAGLSFEDKQMMLFSDMKEELRPYKKDIVRSIHIIGDMVEKTNYPIMAIASNTEKASERLLTYLGFAHNGYETPGGKIFWRIP